MHLATRVSKDLEGQAKNYHKFLEGVAKGLKVEDLDYLMIFSGMEGSGKSNNIKVTAHTLKNFLTPRDKELKITESWFFSGNEFLLALQEVAKEFFREGLNIEINHLEDLDEIDLRKELKHVNLDKMNKLKEKWKWHFWILDEAQDLINLEYMNRFNRSFAKIMMAIRELNMIFLIAFPDITMLNSYVKRFRVKAFNYCFVYPDGSRAMATFTRSKYVRIIMDNPKWVQMYSLLGETFINKYGFDIISDEMPRFPTDTPEYRDYLKLKRLSMANITLRETLKKRPKT